MRLLLLHLSDIHLDAKGENPALLRAHQIAYAALGNAPGVTHVLVLITGDIVDKGQSDAFEWASLFCADLSMSIHEFDPKIELVDFVITPGNHDVVLPTTDEAGYVWRGALNDLRSRPTSFSEVEAPVRICLANQGQFFSFLARVARTAPTEGERLAYLRSYDVGNLKVEVVAVNTSWMCEGKEKGADQGELLALAPQELPAARGPEIRIVLLHHPVSWLQRENGRPLERRLYEYADLVLSGHEHDSSQFVRHKDGGKESAMFEADALQGPNGGFSAILMDSESLARKTISFLWRTDCYVPSSERDWVPLRRGIGGATDGFIFTSDFQEFLDDPGLTRSAKDPRIRLEDVFVYPRLRDITLEVRDTYRDSSHGQNQTNRTHQENPVQKPSQEPRGSRLDPIISAANAIGRIMDERRILIVGESRSGKSTLLRRFVQDLRSLQLVPLLLKPEDCRAPTLEGMHAAIKRRAAEQYGDQEGARFLNVPLCKRVLLLDELHTLELGSPDLRKLLAALASLADHTILAGDDLYLIRQIWASMGASDLLDYRVLRLQDLDPGQQRELAIKMHSTLAQGARSEDVGQELSVLEGNLSAVLGERIVTPFAGEVKAIIRELLQHPNGSGSFGAYGFYYDTQIKNDISAGLDGASKDVVQPQSDAIESFLALLAFRLHTKGDYHADDGDIEAVIEVFRGQKLPINKQALLELLKRARILVLREDGYCFRERYQRYYFLARHLSNMLADDRRQQDARDVLDRLVASIHERECADVVLFTVYLTNSPWLLDKVRIRAGTVFSGEAECDMSADFDFSQVAEDKIVTAGNDFPMSPESESSLAPGPVENLEDLMLDTIREMSEAFNILNILGLAVRNYPARIDVHLREAIVESGYSMSLRSLTAFLNLIRKGRKELEILAVRHLRLPSRPFGAHAPDAGDLITSHLVSLCSFGVVRRTIQAYGSPHLELLLSEIWKDDERVSARMLRFGLQLDLRRAGHREAASFNNELRDNPNARVVLMYLIANHLRSFRATRERRIPLCNAVGLDPDNPAFYYDRERPKAIGGR